MTKEVPTNETAHESIISIIGPGMRVIGDCETEGTLRIEGRIEGCARAGKAVVVAKEAIVQGDIFTQDAVIGGRVTGTVIAESRLELQASCVIEGEVRARRIKLDEGGRVNGSIQTGEGVAQAARAERTGTSVMASAANGPPAEAQVGEAPASESAVVEPPVAAGTGE